MNPTVQAKRDQLAKLLKARASYTASCVHEIFERYADSAPDNLALVREEWNISYAALEGRANQLARYLINLGVGPDMPIGIYLDRGPEFILAILGVLKAGAAYVPLDPSMPDNRIARLLDGIQAPVILTSDSLYGRLPSGWAHIVSLDTDWPGIALEESSRPATSVNPTSLAYILYTSGSTGAPKGVGIEHRNLANYALAVGERMGMGADVYAFVSTFGADLGNTVLFGSLCHGGTLHVIDADLAREPYKLGQYFERHGVDVAKITPTHLGMLLGSFSNPSLIPLKTLVLGGEASDAGWVASVQRLRPDCAIWNHYGPTETTVGVLTQPLSYGGDTPKAIALGRPLANTQVYVLDESLEPVAPGLGGELYVGGANVARGYHQRPDLTAERFIPDPFGSRPGARLYRTGDSVRWLPDGTLEFLGRADDQVKLRGFRIEPGEIEAALLEEAGVRLARVIVREDIADDPRLVAYVVAEPVDFDAARLRAALAAKLPDYMLPSALVRLDALPLTANGKLDRKALPRPEEDMGPIDGYTAPRTAVEEILAGIWAEVLHVEQVGRDSNFFELGGHSLLATQAVSRVRRVLGIELPLQVLFDQKNLAGLAVEVERSLQEESSSVMPLLEPADIGGGDVRPLSFAQQRLWIIDQLEPGDSAYNISRALRLTGDLNITALQESVREIVRRHSVLRTTFPVRNGQPVQLIDVSHSIDFPVTDFSGLDAESAERAAMSLAREEFARPFNLASGPLLRCRLLRLSPGVHMLLAAMHHIVTDAWSTAILIQELTSLYETYAAGEASSLPELPVQYADYAVWQRQSLQGEALDRQIGYWRGQLAGLVPLELPTDYPRPSVPSHQGGVKSFLLDAELTAQLQALSRRQGVTLFMTLLAGWQLLLSRYSNQDDIVVGTPIAGRNRAETEGLIGFFINTLVLRTDLSGNPPFLDLLDRVRGVSLGSFAHQDVPFEQLVEDLQPRRDLSRNPLFQVMFMVQNAPVNELTLSGLTLSFPETGRGTAKFDMNMGVTLMPDGMTGQLEYATEIFDASTAARMTGQFANVLRSIAAAPEKRLSAHSLLSSSERHELLVAFNDTRVEFPADRCVHQFFEDQASRTPGSVAVVFADQELTYFELNARANQLACYLRSLGVGPEVRVGLLLARSLDMIVGLLGILKAGGAYVPLDPGYPEERLAFMLEDSKARLVLTQENLAATLSNDQTQIICIDRDWNSMAHLSSENPVPVTCPRNLAYVIYTSGSTGRPKGVAIAHSSTAALISWALSRFSAAELACVLAGTSICFDLSVFEILVPLSCGGRVLVAANALELSTLPASHGITLVNTVPSAIAELIRLDAIPESVRVVNLAGEPLSALLVDQLHARPILSKVYDLYGPSEDTTYSTCALRSLNGRVTIGSPISNTQAYILDDRLEPAPVGVPGELYLGGDGLARGYLCRPSLTAASFVPNPFLDGHGERLYRTGDLAKYFADGNIEFLGRIDHQVKIRGFRIELGEIEAALSQYPAISAVVVAAREDEPGDKRLVAYLAANEDQGIAVSELRSFLKTRLPEYMVPSAFVILDALPLTPNGKVDRKALPVPEQDARKISGEAPQSLVEELIAQVWADVLRLEQIGRDDNFFELGGHSLFATQVAARVRSVLDVEMPLRILFEAPTLSEFSMRVDSLRRDHEGLLAPPITRSSREDAPPLSYAQHRLWLHSQLEAVISVYNIPAAVKLTGLLNTDALERTINEIVRRHETLRTTFRTVRGQPVQIIHPYAPRSLTITSLEHLPLGDRDAHARQLAQVEAARPFDLETGPLIRVSLLHLSDSEHVTLLTMHHIVSDAWSMGLLIKEVGELYAAYSAHEISPLLELDIQYADFAAWQRHWLQGEVFEKQLAYWREQLADPPTLELPTDYPRPPVQSYRGAKVEFHLSADVTRSLKALSQRESATLFMTLLAAFQALLSRLSGHDDIVVGTTLANRNQSETEGLIGFFVNTLVLRTDFSGDPTFRELLARARATALGAYDHQDLPFEKLVEELQPERDLSRNPLFGVLFEMLNLPLQSADAHEMVIGDLTVDPLELDAGISKFDLRLSLSESVQGVSGFLEYSTDLFESGTARRMLSHFETLLGGIVADPGCRVSQAPILSERELRQMLVDWNDTAAEYPADKCLHVLFEEQAARTPDAVAVVFQERQPAHPREPQLTYAELNTRANQLAHHLQMMGVGPDTLVGLCVEPSLEMVVGLLGVLKAGGAYVPLDPSLPSERLAFLVRDASLLIVLTHERSAGSVPTDAGIAISLDGRKDMLDAMPGDNPPCAAGPQNLAYVIYTSGSTGNPKGSLIVHQGLVNYLTWAARAYDVVSGAGSPVHSPLGFDLTVTGLLPPLLCGRAVTLLAADEPVEELTRVLSEPPAGGWSLLKLTPAHMQALRYAMPASAAFGSRALVIGGEALLASDIEFWRAHAPQTRLINEYGPTETVVGCCVYEVNDATPHDGPVPIGRPIANTQLYVLDKHQQPVPIGVPGELYIGGAGLARGYLNRPDLTAEKFIANPLALGLLDESHVSLADRSPRLYRTGDRVRWLADGNLEYLGRLDDQVKIRGFRIELGEVESALLSQPQVDQAVVIVREEDLGQKRLVAYVVAPEATADDLRGYLLDRLPGYMVPNAYVFLAALPLTPNGKVNRGALPAPDGASQDRGQEYVPARTGSEMALAQIFQQVLSVDRVGIHDNFFELGGDSILAIQVVSKARQVGVYVTPRQLFQHQTIVELAQVAGAIPESEADQGIVTGAVLLTPIQQWYFDQDQPDPSHFNQAALLIPNQDLDPEALAHVLGKLVEHHDALRLRFTPGSTEHEGNSAFLPDLGDQLFAHTGQAAAEVVTIEVIDLSRLEGDALTLAVTEQCILWQRSLNLEYGILLRAGLIRMPEGAQRLFIAIHHLVVDGVSWRILLEDLALAYQQYAGRQPMALSPKTSSVQQWGEALARWANEPYLMRQQDTWLRQAEDANWTMPAAHSNGANTVDVTESVSVTLSSEQTRALLLEAPAAYHTQINDLLLTALAQTLAHWYGRQWIGIALEGHGREDLDGGDTAALPRASLDLSRTVGWFTSLFPVALRVTGDMDGDIKSVKESLRAIPDKGIGYGILRYLGSDAGAREALRSHALPPVSFNYLGQFDRVVGEESAWKPAPESAGPRQSPRAKRAFEIDVIGSVLGGQIRLSLSYSRERQSTADMRQLADLLNARLTNLIMHCRGTRGVYTPSDFPLARLDQDQLDAITLEAVGSGGEIADIYSLSPLQEGLLFHSLLSPDGGDYIVQLCLRIEGTLDTAILCQAWRQAVRRHGILRTSFVTEQVNSPVQVVWRDADLPWREEDWRGLSAEQQEAARAALLIADRARGFVLEQAPLMRVCLMHLAGDAWELVWTFHHVLLDGWSSPLVLQDVLTLYDAAIERLQPECAEGVEAADNLPTPVPYRRYIAWLRKQDLSAAEQFWRERLSGFTTPTPLPVHGHDDGPPRFSAALFQLSHDATAALQEFSRRRHLTVNTVMQGAWGLLLSRYSGVDDVVFGTTISGRSGALPGIEQMIGLFINTLPTRVRIGQKDTVSSWLSRLQDEQQEQRQYEYSPLASIQSWSEAGAGTPLFDSLFVFENYPVDREFREQAARGQNRGLRVSAAKAFEQPHYTLTLVSAPGEEMPLRFQYDAAKLNSAAVERIASHLRSLLDAIVAGPESSVFELPMLSNTERRQLLVEFNDTKADYTVDVCVHQAFEQQAARTPNALAVAYEGRKLTYSELNTRANQLAHYLRKQGIRPEARVGLLVERSLDMVVALLGILKAGGAFVPLDAEYPGERLAFMLEDADARLLITREDLAARVSKAPEHVIRLDLDWSVISRSGDENPPSVGNPRNLAYVIYTSGSTGRPKGVAVSHESLLNLIHWHAEAYHVGPDARATLIASPAFDASVWELWPYLTAGASVHIPDEQTRAFPSTLVEWLARERITHCFVPTPLLESMNEDAWPVESSLRYIVTGGDRLHRGPRKALPFQLVNHYGPTENAVVSTSAPVEVGAESPPIGRPIKNAQAYILDCRLRSVPVGVISELYVAGVGLARGYLNSPDLTAEKFLPNPFANEPGARLYRTGDLARYLPDGNIEFVGRADFQVKVRGFRIELGEIEIALGRHPHVREAAVTSYERPPGVNRLVAYAVLDRNGTADAAALREFLLETLPDYMVPTAVVILDALPLTPNGKIDRKALPVPESQRAEAYVAPRTPKEQILADLWCQVLSLERVGVHDDFFELGGNSLSVTNLVSRIRVSVGGDIPLRTLFEHPTVARLAEWLEIHNAVDTAPPLVRASRSGRVYKR